MKNRVCGVQKRRPETARLSSSKLPEHPKIRTPFFATILARRRQNGPRRRQTLTSEEPRSPDPGVSTGMAHWNKTLPQKIHGIPAKLFWKKKKNKTCFGFGGWCFSILVPESFRKKAGKTPETGQKRTETFSKKRRNLLSFKVYLNWFTNVFIL